MIPNEWNYTLDARHQGFGKIQRIGTEVFLFDERL